jgi:hypothetical protein
MMLIGGRPGQIYSPDDLRTGKCPSKGERLSVKDAAGGNREYILCEVAAAQNLTSGTVVTISGGFVVTVAAVAVGASATNELGVAITTATASASTLIWVQVYGRSSVLASVSQNPAIRLKVGTTAGILTATAPVTASAWVSGIVLTATSGLQSTLAPAILTYPRYMGII